MVDTLRERTALLSMAAGAVLMSGLLAAPAAAADRPTDKDVRQLLERIDSDRDRFEDQLDGKLKDSIVRGPGGEIKVDRYLHDLQENVDKLKDRFSTQYAASAEATTVLRQGSDIQRFMSTQPPNLDGASEWNRLAGSLGELAAAYGTSFPLPDGVLARRMNDDEVRKAAEDAADTADSFKKALDSSLKLDKSISVATREAVVKDADEFKKNAQKLASTIGEGKPSSGEAKALLQHAAAIRGGGHALSPATRTAWASVEEQLGKVAQAYGMPRVP